MPFVRLRNLWTFECLAGESFELLARDGGVLRDGGAVQLRARDGQFLGVDAQLGSRVTLLGKQPSDAFEMFTAVFADRHDRGSLRDGVHIGLRTATGRFVRAADDGAFVADSGSIGTAETFVVNYVPWDLILFRDAVTVNRAFLRELAAEMRAHHVAPGGHVLIAARRVQHVSGTSLQLGALAPRSGLNLYVVADQYTSNGAALDASGVAGAYGAAGATGAMGGGQGGNGSHGSSGTRGGSIALFVQHASSAQLVANGGSGGNGGGGGHGGAGIDHMLTRLSETPATPGGNGGSGGTGGNGGAGGVARLVSLSRTSAVLRAHAGAAGSAGAGGAGGSGGKPGGADGAPGRPGACGRAGADGFAMHVHLGSEAEYWAVLEYELGVAACTWADYRARVEVIHELTRLETIVDGAFSHAYRDPSDGMRYSQLVSYAGGWRLALSKTPGVG